MRSWGRLAKRIEITMGALAIVIGCNTNVIPDGETTALDANGFTDASPGGTGATGGTDPVDTVVDEVVLLAEGPRNSFTAFQIDPTAEDTAGPKFVAGDVDQYGLLDLVTAWNQSQPIQLHLQRRDENDVISSAR